MKWIIGIFIVLDAAYQLFGLTHNVHWNLYYDLIHYGFIISVCLYFIHDKAIPYFLIYFLSITGALIYQYFYGETTSILGPLYIWPILILSLLITILIQRKWAK